MMILLLTVAVLLAACEKNTNPIDVKPLAAFETKINKNVVTFINQSQEAIKHSWDFGDGSDVIISNKKENVNHIYDEIGTYEVVLKVENMSGESEKVKTVVVNEVAKETEASTQDATSTSISKLTAPFELIMASESDPAKFYLQLSKSEDFMVLEDIYTERYFSTKELELNPSNSSHEFKNLAPEETYFYRIKMETTQGESFSNVSSGVTKSLEGIGTLTVKAYDATMFEVLRSISQPEDNCLEEYPEHTSLIFATDAEFKNAFAPAMVGHIMDTYYREAGTKVFVQSTVSFKGKELNLRGSIETTDMVVARQSDNFIFTSAIASAYSKAIVLGDSNAERISFNIPAGLTETGTYSIKAGEAETANNFYMNYFDADNRKYCVNNALENTELEIYRIEGNVVYGRVKEYVSLKHEGTGKTISFSPIIFKAEKN